MRRIIFLFPFLLMILSCVTLKQDTSFKPIKYFIRLNDRKFNYEFEVPKGYTLNKIINSKSGVEEFLFIYDSGAMIYISDNLILLPHVLNVSNIYNSFPNHKNTQFGEESDIGGQQKDGKYWREYIIGGNINLGYLNVSKNKKEAFDKAISSLSSKTNFKDHALQHEIFHTKQ